MQKQKKKSLLIYAHYYVPDTASTGQLLCELAEGVLDRFNVTVICVVPSYTGDVKEEYTVRRFYRENVNGVKVIRVRVPEFRKADKRSRIKNILAYFFGAAAATLKTGKADYVLAVSQPPILGGLLGVWGKWVKHAKLIYNIQDFNPEQVMAVHYSGNKTLLGLMMRLDKFSCRRSHLVITVGRDLAETLQRRFTGMKAPRWAVINNWVDEQKIYPVAASHPCVTAFKEKYGLTEKFVFMYSGNLGLYYDLENILKVIEKIKPGTVAADGREVAFAFVGDGSALENMAAYKEKHCLDNVVFIPYQDKERLVYSLNAGDVHWVVNAKGIKGVSCPSKYYGVAAAAKACLCVQESGTEIRRIVEETQGGLCSEPGDYRKMERNILWFIEHAGSEKITAMGKRSRDNLLKNLTRDVSIKKYTEEILAL